MGPLQRPQSPAVAPAMRQSSATAALFLRPQHTAGPAVVPVSPEHPGGRDGSPKSTLPLVATEVGAVLLPSLQPQQC